MPCRTCGFQRLFELLQAVGFNSAGCKSSAIVCCDVVYFKNSVRILSESFRSALRSKPSGWKSPLRMRILGGFGSRTFASRFCIARLESR